jgi:hypothetical protein
MNKNLKTIFVVAGLGLAQLPAWAQSAWPEKPVRIIVPYAPGGTTDYAARQVAQKLTEQTKQSFYVAFRPGTRELLMTESQTVSMLTAELPAQGQALYSHSTSK